MRSGSSSSRCTSSGTPSVSTLVRHSSWKRGAGRYSPMRCTTAAAVISALSALNGVLPWPGVPRTRRRAPGDALLPDVDADVRRFARPAVQPAVLGEHVVGADRVGARGRPSTACRARCPTPRRRRRSRSGRPSAGSRCGRGGGTRRPSTTVRFSMSTAPRPHTSAVDQLAAERVAASSRPRSPARRRCGPSGTGYGASGSVPSMRATSDCRSGRRARTAARRARCRRGTGAARRRCASRGRTSPVPSLTQRLRMSVCSSSTVCPVRSSLTAASTPSQSMRSWRSAVRRTLPASSRSGSSTNSNVRGSL